MKFDITEMKKGHLDQIAELEKACFSMPWNRDMLAAELNKKYAVYYVAVADNMKVAGYVGMHMIYEEGYITNLATAPDFRRMGIAKALLGKVIDLCRIKGLTYLTLEVRESNAAAISLYEGSGFRIIGRRRDYYQKPVEDALIMFLSI